MGRRRRPGPGDAPDRGDLHLNAEPADPHRSGILGRVLRMPLARDFPSENVDVAGEEGPSAPATMTNQKDRSREALLNGPVTPTLIKLALPTMVVLLAQTAVNLIEAYYVSRLGTAALAGVALVFPALMLMMTMSGGGMGGGVASAVARAIGAGRNEDADALVLHAIVIAIVAGAVFTAISLVFGRTIYSALGGRDAALDAAVEYSGWLFLGAIPAWIVNLIAAALRGSGNVRVPALTTLVGALVLIPVSPALIFGFGPIPRLGIAGAGVAFAGFYICAAIVLMGYLATGRTNLSLKITPFRSSLFAAILKVGLPSSVTASLSNVTVILVTAAVGLFGTNALAGYGIGSRLDYLIIPVLFGLSSAVLTMVGANMGAGQTARAKKIAWIGAGIGVLIAETIGLSAAVAPGIWVNLYTQAPEVAQPAETYLRIVAPFYGFVGLAFVLSFAAQGAGYVLWPFLGMSARLIIAAGGGWLTVKVLGLGLTGLSIIIAASLVCYAAVCGGAMASRRIWRSPSPAT